MAYSLVYRVTNCCSHGTFPHFSPQSSHLSNWYCHHSSMNRWFRPNRIRDAVIKMINLVLTWPQVIMAVWHGSVCLLDGWSSTVISMFRPALHGWCLENAGCSSCSFFFNKTDKIVLVCLLREARDCWLSQMAHMAAQVKLWADASRQKSWHSRRYVILSAHNLPLL